MMPTLFVSHGAPQPRAPGRAGSALHSRAGCPASAPKRDCRRECALGNGAAGRGCGGPARHHPRFWPLRRPPVRHALPRPGRPGARRPRVRSAVRHRAGQRRGCGPGARPWGLGASHPHVSGGGHSGGAAVDPICVRPGASFAGGPGAGGAAGGGGAGAGLRLVHARPGPVSRAGRWRLRRPRMWMRSPTGSTSRWSRAA